MSQIATLPNLITFARILSVPLVAGLVYAGTPALRWVALIVFVLAAASDWLDGYLARRMNLVSPLGQMLDPIADKLLVLAMAVTLSFDGTLGLAEQVPALLILMREVLVSGLREFLGPRNVVVHVSGIAKWKTTIQLVAFALLIARPLVGFPIFAEWVLWLAAILTVYTGYDYFRGAWPHLRGDAR